MTFSTMVFTHNCPGVDKDERTAFHWYMRAAELGDADAQNCIGCYYDSGGPVEQSQRIAALWYQRATDQGHVGATYNLALCYYYVHYSPMIVMVSYYYLLGFRSASGPTTRFSAVSDCS